MTDWTERGGFFRDAAALVAHLEVLGLIKNLDGASDPALPVNGFFGLGHNNSPSETVAAGAGDVDGFGCQVVL